MATVMSFGMEKPQMLRMFISAIVVLAVLVAPDGALAQGTETVVYFHTDAIGSVRMTTDANAQVLQRYDYLPFGEPWPSPTPPETRRFAGGELDLETQLNHFGARQYYPQTGRFTRTDDPGYGNPFDPQSMNFYAYVMNNPLRWVDPSGHHHNGGCHGIADYPHPVCPGVDVDVTPDPQLPYFPFFPPNYPGGGGGGGRQGAPGPKTPPLQTPPLQCQADIIAAMSTIWSRSQNGESGIEGSFNVNGSPSDYRIVINPTTNQLMKQEIRYQTNTFAIFHVHPNRSGRNAWRPSPDDLTLAAGTKRPLQWYIVSREGLGFYDAATKQPPTRLRPGLEWGTPCN